MGGPSVQHCRHMYVGKQEQSYLGQSVEQSHGPLFSFLWQKRKQGSRKAKQAQIGGEEPSDAPNKNTFYAPRQFQNFFL